MGLTLGADLIAVIVQLIDGFGLEDRARQGDDGFKLLATIFLSSLILRASISLAAIHAMQARTMLMHTMKPKYMSPPRQPLRYSWLWRTGR